MSARRHLHKNLIGLDHAQLDPRALFDHAEARAQILHFRRQLLVDQARLRVGGLLLIHLALQRRHVGQAAAADPQLGVDDDQQHDQHERDDAIGHDKGERPAAWDLAAIVSV